MEKNIYEDNIMVSVVCLSYNHVDYIRDALEGFVTQKTSFRYEVIVHDDASCDGTVEIIREYEKRYPQIIKPIYQSENQYSKNVNFNRLYILPKIHGKYVAFCEGDDYWCNQNKLQIQFDFLETHTEYSGCGHRHYMLNCENGEMTIHNNEPFDCDVENKVVMEWNGLQFHTSSYMFKREFYDVPDSFYMRNVGNYPQLVWIALHGKLFQFAEVMSVYRFLAKESWSRKNLSSEVLLNRKQLIEDSINMLAIADKYASEREHEDIIFAINKHKVELTSLEGKFFSLLFNYRKELKLFTISRRIRILIRALNPELFYQIKFRKGR